jgi:hypothetical protein
MGWVRVGVLLAVSALGGCGLPTGPAGEMSAAGRYNPVSHEVNSSGR